MNCNLTLLISAIGLCMLAMPPILLAASSDPEFVPNEVIVQYKPSSLGVNQKAQVSRMRTVPRQIILPENKRTDGKGELALVKLSAPLRSNQDLAKTLQAIAQDPEVEYAEPNWHLHKLEVQQGDIKSEKHRPANFPNDKHYSNGDSWGMYGNHTQPANPLRFRSL